MSITTALLYFVARARWRWSRGRGGALLALFWAFDLSFFATCFSKITHGGWFPLFVASSVFTVMVTWKKGRKLLADRLAADVLPLEAFIEDLDRVKPPRVAGTAVFLASLRRGTPGVLLHHFKHNKCLHRQVVVLSIVTDAVPEVAARDVVHLKAFAHGFWAITAHHGFMQTPDVLGILAGCEAHGLRLDPADISFYVGRETLVVDRRRRTMSSWRKRLFLYLSRNACWPQGRPRESAARRPHRGVHCVRGRCWLFFRLPRQTKGCCRARW
jgi:KUP system potassium uptake protein